jgi:hypothetical protein
MKRKSDDEQLRRALLASIEQYRQWVQNDHGHATLDRILDGLKDRPEWVLPAFEIAPQNEWPTLFFACLRASEAERLHKETIEQARRDIEATDKAQQALDRIEEWLRREKQLTETSPRSDAVAFPLRDNSSELGPVEGGRTIYYREDNRRGYAAIDLLRSQIVAAQRRAADELRMRSQKTDIGGSRAAAVGWIKAAYLAAAPSARNSRSVVAKLASAVLGDAVSEDAARWATTPREWLAR